MDCGGGICHSKTKFQTATEFGFFPRRNLRRKPAHEHHTKGVKNQEGKANSTCIKKRDEHKRQVGHEN